MDEKRVVRGLKGLRKWRVGIDRETHEPILVSTYMRQHAWRDPTHSADSDPTKSPVREKVAYGHGIYVLSADHPDAKKTGDQWDEFVIGVVECIGPTAIHEHGYRTTKAMIRKLVLPACRKCGHRADYLCFMLDNCSVSVYPTIGEGLPLDTKLQDVRRIIQEAEAHLVATNNWRCRKCGPTSKDGIAVPELIELWERRYGCDVTHSDLAL